MLKVQGVVTKGKEEFFKGIQFSQKGDPFVALRIQTGTEENPRWNTLYLWGNEKQLENFLGFFNEKKSVLVRANVNPVVSAYTTEEGEVKESLRFSTRYDRMEIWQDGWKKL